MHSCLGGLLAWPSPATSHCSRQEAIARLMASTLWLLVLGEETATSAEADPRAAPEVPQVEQVHSRRWHEPALSTWTVGAAPTPLEYPLHPSGTLRLPVASIKNGFAALSKQHNTMGERC